MALDITSYAMGKKKGGGGTPPTYQDKEITITANGEQTITADSGYDALRKVDITTNVPQPSGKITITQNGTDIDVSSYASADVNVPAGADLSEYFNTSFSASGGQQTNPLWVSLVKKLNGPIEITGNDLSYAFYKCPYVPEFTLKNNVSNLFSAFYQSTDTGKLNITTNKINANNLGSAFRESKFEEISFTGLGSVNTASVELSSMFYWCANLKKISLPNFTTPFATSISASFMFAGSTLLEEIDMPKFDFTKITNSTNMFNNVPDNCLIYVKDQTQKDWFTTNFSRFTNVQIKGA